jgi:orotidine-5'-phosphate decarboxylase
VAKRRSGKSASRREEVEDLVELVAALSNIRNGGNGHKEPLMDPSVNVKELVELRADYEKEIRNLNDKWQERFDLERQRTAAAERIAEAGRVDAKFSDIGQSALLAQAATEARAATLATTLATATETLRKSQETTDLATRAAIRAVEQNQATGGGEKLAKADQRTQSNFNLAQWITVGGILLIVAVDLHRNGVI